MKKLLLILLCLPMIGFGQSVPQGINYQAVARDANGDILMNQALTIQFSVISDITTGNVSWQETQTVSTNDYGLYTAIIGQGTSTSVGSSATFDVIDWGASNHLLKVEVDYGNGLVDMGTTAFMSVPYSMNASNVDPTDELQSLSLSGDTLFISDGNFVILPTPTLLGCTDSLAFNYNALANTDDSSCVDKVFGCTSILAYNYDSLANVDDGSCIAIILGCTDLTAFNYDVNANTDDGSCIAVVNGCTDSTAFNYNSLANTDDGSCLEIGSTYQGGIIFYLDGNGGGLIAAPSDQSFGKKWGCDGNLISGADGTAIGTGNQNTIDIEAGCTTPGIAADICANLTLGGYSDWFLPSKDELNQMYLNLFQQGLSDFAINYYWSSTEGANNVAWCQDPINGHQVNYSKDYNLAVRAVRAF